MAITAVSIVNKVKALREFRKEHTGRSKKKLNTQAALEKQIIVVLNFGLQLLFRKFEKVPVDFDVRVDFETYFTASKVYTQAMK